MFVNSVLFPFSKRFQPSLWESGRGGFVSVRRRRRRCFCLFCFVCYFHIWHFGWQEHFKKTWIRSPEAPDGNYFAMLPTDIKWDYSSDSFYGFFLISISKKWRQQNLRKLFCNIIIFLHSYFFTRFILYLLGISPINTAVKEPFFPMKPNIFYLRFLRWKLMWNKITGGRYSPYGLS